MILIFHLSLSQGGLAGGTPMDRFLSLVDGSIQKKLPELPDNGCLILKLHRQIRILPFTKDPQTLEFFPLNIHKLGGVIPAPFPDFNEGEFSFLHPKTFLDLMLNRQPVAVPSRNIGAIHSGHELRFHDEVLQDLVQGRSDMDIPIGIRRTVMKDIFRPPFCLPTKLMVNLFVFPFLQDFGLPLSQIGLHGKVRFG